MTLLWIGLVLAGAFVLFFGYLIVLGLLDRFRPMSEVDDSDDDDLDLFPPRQQLRPYVPPHLRPHMPWSDVKARRERDTPPPNDPAS